MLWCYTSIFLGLYKYSFDKLNYVIKICCLQICWKLMILCWSYKSLTLQAILDPLILQMNLNQVKVVRLQSRISLGLPAQKCRDDSFLSACANAADLHNADKSMFGAFRQVCYYSRYYHRCLCICVWVLGNVYVQRERGVQETEIFLLCIPKNLDSRWMLDSIDRFFRIFVPNSLIHLFSMLRLIRRPLDLYCNRFL